MSRNPGISFDYEDFEQGWQATDAMVHKNRDFAQQRPGQLTSQPEDDWYEDQTPFAAVLACSDARVPVSHMFQQGPNRIFQVRLAGNVLSDEAIGSLEYAIGHFPMMKSLVVLGHSHCGAVGAAVSTFQAGKSADQLSVGLGALVRRILPRVEEAQQLSPNPDGDHWLGLGPLSILLNASQNALWLDNFTKTLGREDIVVTYGVFNLADRLIYSWNPQDGYHNGLSLPIDDIGQLANKR